MEKKKFLTIFLACIAVLSVRAVSYRILHLNSQDILIDNEKAQTGMEFDDSQVIKWINDRQSMRVLNLKNKKILTVASKDLYKNEPMSFSSLLNHYKLSTRELGKGEFLADSVYYLSDALYLEAGKKRETAEYFVEVEGDGSLQKIEKNEDGSYLVIPRDLIMSKGNTAEKKISIYAKEGDWCYPLYKDLKIVVMPEMAMAIFFDVSPISRHSHLHCLPNC